jgi:hypothetical protein
LASILQATSASHVRRTLRSEAVSDELRSNQIFIWRQYCSHGEIFRHGHQECCANLVLLSSARNNHIMAEAEVRRFLRLRAQAPTVPNEMVIEAMIKGLRPGPTTQYFARKPPQTLEKLLQKMDEYIRADNDFRQRREEAYRFSEMTRGFGGRIHPRHVRSIHYT